MKVILLFTGLGLFSTITTYSQNQAPTNTTTQGQTLVKPTQGSTQNEVLTINLPQQTQPVFDYNDPYLGRKFSFDRMFIAGEVPADFPKYTKELSLEQYDSLIKTYLQFNADLLTDKFRKKYSK